MGKEEDEMNDRKNFLENNPLAKQSETCIDVAEGDIRYQGQKEHNTELAAIWANLAVAFELSRIVKELKKINHRADITEEREELLSKPQIWGTEP